MKEKNRTLLFTSCVNPIKLTIKYVLLNFRENDCPKEDCLFNEKNVNIHVWKIYWFISFEITDKIPVTFIG
jgi:hypothetical protein